jgi:N-acetylglucosaminyldiphosphoundecaprenol N-acetyl-beta-D-mannosaminyltransferase
MTLSYDPATEKRFSMLGIRIGGMRFGDAVPLIEQFIEKNHSSYICIVNVHVLVTAARDRHFKTVVNGSDWNFADGMPLVWYGKRCAGLERVERTAGPSLMLRCMDTLRDRRHFLYGATLDALERIEQKAKKAYPGINIVGRHSPPFRNLTDSEKGDIASRINRVSPDIIWVALGAPKQELWMREFQNRLNRGVIIGVGAAFDFFAGTLKRPPVWLRRAGFEWLGRLFYEPRRLLKRYLITNSLFAFYLIREIGGCRSLRKKRKKISS